MIFTRAGERAHPYVIVQNGARVGLHEVNIKEELEVNVSSGGLNSLWLFIRDMNNRFNNLILRYQLMFQGISVPGQVVASLSLRNIESQAVLRVALQEAFERMSQRSSDSWEQVFRYYGLNRRGALRDMDLDIIFAAPIVIGISSDGYGACRSTDYLREFKINDRLTLKVKSHRSQGDNCAFECLRFKNGSIPSISVLRKQFDIKGAVSWEQLERLSTYVQCPVRVIKINGKRVTYMDGSFVDFKKSGHLVLLHRFHYWSVLDVKTIDNRCIKCGEYYEDEHECTLKAIQAHRFLELKNKGRDLFFDIETRSDINDKFHVKDKVFYPQKAVLACWYVPATGLRKIVWGLNCIAEFIDWLEKEKVFYYIRAHNGGAFDYYFIIHEILKRSYDPEDFNFNNVLLRGSSKILSIEFKGHRFLDTYNHLVGSLEYLCNSFKVETKKITSCIVNGKEWSSKEIMLLDQYELTPEQYIQRLREIGLAQAYEDYCLTDCISLAEVWESYYDSAQTLFKKALPKVSASSFTSSFSNKLTIPSLAKWGWLEKQKELKKKTWFPVLKTRAYELSYSAVIGGISHVQHYGYHSEPLVCLDVVSLYVWAMMQNVYPVGEPLHTEVYVRGKLGVYMCSYVKCKDDPITDIPVLHDGVLDWTKTECENRSLSSIDIERIWRRGGTVEIIDGIYWEESENCFKDFLEVFTAEKKRQDTLVGTDEYNESLRNVTKLIGNALYGKMLERSAKTSLSIVDHPNDLFGMDFDFTQCWIYRSNGKYIVRTPSTAENKSPFHLGVFVLAYSRDLMMSFFDKVGRENVIATETDSLYIKQEHAYRLQDVIGKEVGMLSIDIENIVESYFLSKKGYALRYMVGNQLKEKFRLKGVHKEALKWEKYEEWYQTGSVTFNDIQVFVRHLFDLNNTQIHIGKLDKTVTLPNKRQKVK
jgi:hypothetical protein